jgi:hypothetical protein
VAFLWAQFEAHIESSKRPAISPTLILRLHSAGLSALTQQKQSIGLNTYKKLHQAYGSCPLSRAGRIMLIIANASIAAIGDTSATPSRRLP